MGGYGVYFGAEHDVAKFISLIEEQTNIRGELRASLCALERHRRGGRTLICPDYLLIVNGVMGWVLRWHRHNWCNAQGPIKHRDLWEPILSITETLGEEVKWLHTPSHIGIPGNTRADHLANVGRRKPPLSFGHISIHPRNPPEPEEMELEEDPIVAWHEWQPADDAESPPLPPHEEGALLQHTPQRGGDGHRNLLTPSRPLKSPLWDIEVCTPTHDLKRQRLHTPVPFL